MIISKILVYLLFNHFDTFLSLVSDIALVLTAIIAYKGIKNSNENLSKQLEIEQTPYVVIEGGISLEGKVFLKNIGRGMALRVILLLGGDKWNENFHDPKTSIVFTDNHSKELGSNGSMEVVVNYNNISKAFNLVIGEEPRYLDTLYIFYSDQLGNRYRNRVSLKKEGETYLVMEIVNEGKLYKKGFEYIKRNDLDE